MPSAIVIAQSIAKVLAPKCFQNEAPVFECVFECVFGPTCSQNMLELENVFQNMFQCYRA